MNNKFVLLDTDFISKLHITRIADNDTAIDRILEITNFEFYIHKQIMIELSRHNSDASIWLKEKIDKKAINCYSDKDIIESLESFFGKILSKHIFIEELKNSCLVYSNGFFDKYYSSLSDLITEDTTTFLSQIEHCDNNVGTDNNLGEIKNTTLSKCLSRTTGKNPVVFCSDDRKARVAYSSSIPDATCVSVIAAFYLFKSQLNMEKPIAKAYFDSWMTFLKSQNGQADFKVCLNISKNTIEKINGYQIFDDIYNEKMKLRRDGILSYKEALI